MIALAASLLGVLSAPAAAEWTRIPEIPATDVFAVRIVGDTIAAGVGGTAYVSADGGASWRHAEQIGNNSPVDGLWIRNGRVYAGTFGGGVFVSDDLGASWQPFNEGLVGGVLNSQLAVGDLEVLGDRLFAGTLGAGVYVRTLATGETWHPFGQEFEPNQASNVNDIAVGGTRLLACAGANGTTFHRDPADADWTVDFIVGGTLHPGLIGYTALWTGSRWVLGTGSSVFTSANGQAPWVPSTTSTPHPSWATFAQFGPVLAGAFDVLDTLVMAESRDGGDTWVRSETLHGVFGYQLATRGGALYAARSDGLWIRTGIVSVVPGPTAGLRFALATQPVQNVARFRFELANAADASIELYDLRGRRAAERATGSWSAGVHDWNVDVHGLSPGVYWARLTSGSQRESARFIRIR